MRTSTPSLKKRSYRHVTFTFPKSSGGYYQSNKCYIELSKFIWQNIPVTVICLHSNRLKIFEPWMTDKGMVGGSEVLPATSRGNLSKDSSTGIKLYFDIVESMIIAIFYVSFLMYDFVKETHVKSKS